MSSIIEFYQILSTVIKLFYSIYILLSLTVYELERLLIYIHLMSKFEH